MSTHDLSSLIGSPSTPPETPRMTEGDLRFLQRVYPHGAALNSAQVSRAIATYHALAASQKEVERLTNAYIRVRDERAALLNVKTTDGLTASEWLMRTALAEREVERLLETEKLAAKHLIRLDDENAALRAQLAAAREDSAREAIEALTAAAGRLYWGPFDVLGFINRWYTARSTDAANTEAEANDLRASLAVAQADTARLRWVMEEGHGVAWRSNRWVAWSRYDAADHEGETYNAAIDAASRPSETTTEGK